MKLNFFKSLGRKAAATVTYDQAKRIARRGSSDERRELARRPDTRPELLYYLADDETSAVRRAVAGNAATPPQANVILARDEDDDVRCELARKICRILPGLSRKEAEKLRDLAIETLEILAQDQLSRVRAILAEELKSSNQAPRSIVLKLANDVDSAVATPILKYSPLLSDNDLLEIIAKGAVDGRVAAIARRQGLGATVSGAIVATHEVPAAAALLQNRSAEIGASTLDNLIERAASIEALHEPLVMRAELSVRAIRRIAGFVAAGLIEALCRRHDVDENTASELRRAVQRRIKVKPVAADPDSPERRAKGLHMEGRLDDESICDAIDRNERAFVMAALALLTERPVETLAKIVETRNPKAVTVLAWRAGLAMRTATRLQHKLALVPPAQILHARNGVVYPMSESEMAERWELLTA